MKRLDHNTVLKEKRLLSPKIVIHNIDPQVKVSSISQPRKKLNAHTPVIFDVLVQLSELLELHDHQAHGHDEEQEARVDPALDHRQDGRVGEHERHQAVREQVGQGQGQAQGRHRGHDEPGNEEAEVEAAEAVLVKKI
jgi:hypothetical protein